MNDLFELLFPLLLLFAVIFLFIWLALKFKRSGKSAMAVMHGALYEMYDNDRRAAVEQVLEQNTKKMEEQENDKPIE